MPKTLTLVVAAVLVWLAPLSAQQPASPPRLAVAYEMFTLPNGLTVILHEDHSVPQVSVNVWYHVGSAFEKPGRTGFAHLFEHLMFEGSGHVKEGLFDSLLEAAGGSNNGSTTEDRTNYFEQLPSNSLDLALYDVRGRLVRVLADSPMLAAPDHSVIWDGNDRFGIPARSGTYFYRLETPSWSESQKMTLLR